MATRLTRPVVRQVDAVLQAKGFRSGFVVRLAADGVHVKPNGARWTSAYFVSWGDIVLTGAMRKAKEDKAASVAKRAARRAARAA